MWGRWFTAIAIAFAAAAPALAECRHSQSRVMCQWEERTAVEEWRVQQLRPEPQRHRHSAEPERKSLGWWTSGTGPVQFHICEVGGEEDDCFWVE